MWGRTLNGGGSSANGIFVDACRLRLGPKARLDAAQGRQYFSAAPTEITIGESMITEPGSKIRGRRLQRPLPARIAPGPTGT